MAAISRALKSLVFVAVAAGALTACSSDEATYRPQPRSTPGSRSCGGAPTATTTQPAYTPPAYTQPAQPYTPPAATTTTPSKPSGQMSCGKGKCG